MPVEDIICAKADGAVNVTIERQDDECVPFRNARGDDVGASYSDEDKSFAQRSRVRLNRSILQV
jgi:hypothetical protein